MAALIPKAYWSFPKWVNEDKARRLMKDMEQKNILYGGSLSYRHMCRFNSGFFYRLDVMKKYDFYWRVEPCKMTIDYTDIRYGVLLRHLL
jgi:alpha 1,2-mannosyltransferase